MFEKNLLKDKTIIVTGGGTGLGKSMSQRFCELGANLVIAGRREAVLEGTAAELRTTGAKALPVQCDVRDTAEVQSMVERTVDEFGAVDVLINNAAGNFISPTEKLSEGGFRVIIDIVLHGTFNCTMAAAKKMMENSGGTVLNIITTYAWTGSGYVVPSACAKAGVLAMTRSLAVEWAKYGIRTNAIAPGPFPTEGAWKRLTVPGLGVEKKMKKRIPLGRFGEHEELANLASFMVSDGAGYINGEVVTIDGGEWLKGAGQFNELEKIPEVAWKVMAAVRKKRKKK
ncbi:MAG: SDR family oxidoreductase [Candidatus Marinimicrobia bacterium]|jgi:NAD(P)-dependent dehydrogenase (short-subunit alcohol dehydrogenase family)|nr:2,4-dienoyl-CoA reductase [Candidatus Neomarinimicrobiota bacterium]MDP6457627.1 SDR family oxidoreductase [Candidatus Neomarinimicrobiota bacterium]MDP6594199.1 SDR family oxidoreductase [Candidatus Neomarinimicrobiota bacterium]MDP6836954.1 SDR family oxidoreductase [Candidatus Neomarinimicrobiota bacterium]MDP6967382.1 SDR family oxidoreductase [Candidatus Neomarinimicrobiota bacterium]|tara:strand:- start:1753 stop:2607 length:855 start_codon:yes stop_codon:yes gene_type:complete